MQSFKVILEHNDIEGKFIFATVTDCKDRDECINHLKLEHPLYHIEQITSLPKVSARGKRR